MRTGALVVVVWLAAAAGARAQDRVVVDWQAPADACPPGDVFVAETERALGPAEGPPHAALHVDAHVVRGADGRLVLEMVMHFPDGDAARALVASRCDALVHAGALVLALALAPERPASVEPPGEPATQLTPPRLTLPQASDSEVPWRTRRPVTGARTHRWALEIVASGFLDVGTMPGAAPGASIGAGIQYDELHLEALFLALPSADGTGGGSPTTTATFTLLAARIDATLELLRTERLVFAPLLALELGSLTGRISGLQSVSVLELLVSAGARLSYDFGLVALRLDFEATFAPRPNRFTVGPAATTLYDESVVGLRISLGAAVHFP